MPTRLRAWERRNRPIEDERPDPIDLASRDSFPASDPPPWTLGPPRRMQLAPQEEVVGAVFPDEAQATAALQALLAAHFDPAAQISVLVAHGGEKEEVPVVGRPIAAAASRTGAAIGAALGAAGATLVALGAVAGPVALLAAGPILAFLEGAAVGGMVGGLAGTLAGFARLRDEIAFEAAQVRGGVVWIGVQATGARAREARRILLDAGARHFLCPG